MNIGDVRHVVRRVAITMLAFEAVFALVLAGRFRARCDDAWGEALWHGLFHSISAFNNAGFALYSDNLMGFVSDAWIGSRSVPRSSREGWASPCCSSSGGNGADLACGPCTPG